MDDVQLLQVINEKLSAFISRADKMLDDHEKRLREAERCLTTLQQVNEASKEDVKDLKAKFGTWNVANSVASAISTVIAFLMR